MKKKEYGIAIENWPWNHKAEVRMWLVENFGVHGDRWYEEPEYGVENLVMDEEVYFMYKLRWS